jgi:hypothetical protein
VQTLILRGVFLCRRADVDYFLQGNAVDFAAHPLAMPVPGAYLDFPTAWRHFVDAIPPEDRGDVVKGLAKIFAAPPRTEAERECQAKAASVCVAWEGSVSHLRRDENSHGQPNEKYALTAARILVHYMINGGFLDANGEANRDNNYILDHVARLRDIPVNVVHGRYDRVCHAEPALPAECAGDRFGDGAEPELDRRAVGDQPRDMLGYGAVDASLPGRSPRAGLAQRRQWLGQLFHHNGRA